MSKVKSSTKAAKPTKSDVLTKVKSGGVAKPAKEDKVAKKELAKKAEKEEKKSKKDKKKAKEPTPEPDSDAVSSESESSDSESEAETKKAATNGKASKKAAAKEDSSDDSDSSSEDEAPAPKKADAKTNGAKVAAKKDESDSDSSDSSDDEEEVAPKVNKAAAKDDSDDSESSDDDEEAKPKVNGSALPADAADDETDSDASDSDSSSEDDEEKPAKTNKRKAEDDAEPTTKKAKTEVTTTATGEESTQKNLFVGNLSWNIDEAWLRETFEEHGELSGCRVMTDKATGRSKGFGYVEFVKAEDAAAAYEAKKGFELDNREINLDWASAKPNNQDSQNDRRKQYGDQLSEPTDTLFVGNLSFDVGQEQVSEAFASHGTILSVRLPTQPDTGLPKGFGYVTFSTVEEATGALESMQGSYLSNRPVRLDYSQPRPPRDDNGGGRGRGGFGGRGGGRGRGGFGDRGGRGGGRGFGDRGGRGGRGGSFGGRGRGASTNRGGFGDFQGQKKSFD